MVQYNAARYRVRYPAIFRKSLSATAQNKSHIAEDGWAVADE